MSDAPLVLHYSGTIPWINRKLGDNQSLISLYAQFIHFWKKRGLILYIPALCLGDMSPKKPEMKQDRNHQWDVHAAHPDIDRWWISISAFMTTTWNNLMLPCISCFYLQVFLIPVSRLHSVYVHLIRGCSGRAAVVTRGTRPQLDGVWIDKELRVFHACIFSSKVCCVLLRSIDWCRALTTLTWDTKADMHTSYRYSSTSPYFASFQ